MEKKNENGARIIIKNYVGKKGKREIAQRLQEQQSKHEEWMKLTENERWAEIQKTLNYEKKKKEKDEKDGNNNYGYG